MVDNDDKNNELAHVKLTKDDSSHDPLLLSGEPFIIKSHWIYKAVGWLGLCFVIASIVSEINTEVFDLSSAYISGTMIVLDIFLLIMARTSVSIDQHSITIVRAIGRYQIKWDEIQKIVFDTKLQKVVFYGKDKWLVMPRIVPYVSGRRFGVAEYVNMHVRLRRIHVEFSENTPSRSKNTMISIF